jgi:hypothetical protein
MSIEVSTIRRRVQQRLEQARQAATVRRVKVTDAERQYEVFLEQVALPVFRAVASVLSSEAHPYKVFTPGGSVRLASDRSTHTFVELRLDTSGDTPQVVAEISRQRGSRILADDQPVRAGALVEELTDEDVLAVLLDAISAMVER